ncbi:ABC transporter ATP-binding protein [Phyllobacterium chamaecytisi]|uniref:ABC transporter ATP-binding protein n=1 Tax=Phyllobacterium chamaecytisi TaxID=2876082 RepID=UPI001CCEAB3B|nr:ABC transporter ATP-binding protein [Phyllobacterium sp. KW56]MBZ9602988.1 ABC transporter ATP-binding protein [Phyllobacterium sp. KW56]
MDSTESQSSKDSPAHCAQKAVTAGSLSVRNLTVLLGKNGRSVPIVQSLSFDIKRAEMVALVGESGSGKSVTCRAIMGLLPGYMQRTGELFLGGAEIPQGRVSAQTAMVFQDPVGTLNPVRTIGFHLKEVLSLRRSIRGALAYARAVELLRQVGLREPERAMTLYPHQLSGGMNQRVGIALALAGNPSLLLADEPTSSLDTTTQAQIMDLLAKVREEAGLAILFVTHDLGLVSQRADRVIVMYGGQMVESGTPRDLFENPRHPYTAALIASLPRVGGEHGQLRSIPGKVPPPGEGPAFCRFADRCSRADETCHAIAPPWITIDPNHLARCHHAAR